IRLERHDRCPPKMSGAAQMATIADLRNAAGAHDVCAPFARMTPRHGADKRVCSGPASVPTSRECAVQMRPVGESCVAWTLHDLRAIFAGMDMDTLKIFLAVAQQGSFAAVARDMGNDPSAISRSIALLESELGIRLFQRSTRAMALTEAGERYRS